MVVCYPRVNGAKPARRRRATRRGPVYIRLERSRLPALTGCGARRGLRRRREEPRVDTECRAGAAGGGEAPGSASGAGSRPSRPGVPPEELNAAAAVVPAPHGRGVVVELSGEIDSAEADAIGEVLEEAIAGAPVVLLDLSAVRFFGSAGLALVVEAHRAALARRVAFAVVAGEGNRAVTRPLSITGVDSRVRAHPAVAAAPTALVPDA
jgi:anti-sigma B factor antagonist